MPGAGGLHENVHTLEFQRVAFDIVGDAGPRGVGFLLDAVDDLHEDGEINITGISQRARGVSAEKHPRLRKLFLQLVDQAFLGLGESGWGRRKTRRHHHGAKKSIRMPDVRSHGISFRAT